MLELASRERMLRALNQQEVDHIPCCFMSFTALRKRVNEDLYALVQAEKGLGFDSMLFIPVAPRPQRADHPDLRGLPMHMSPEVALREWREEAPGELGVLHKEYMTPAGTLTTAVRLSEDWPHGGHIPLMDDYQIPRALKPLITREEELEALRYLILPPQAEDRRQFQAEAATARVFAAREGVLLAGGWGVGMDMLNWFCGSQNLMVLALEQPEFIARFLEMVHVWNKQRMELVLSAPVDLYIRRAWYEGVDFVTPAFFRREILPRLRAEVELAHDHGAKFGYICSSGAKPLLDDYRLCGMDVLIGVDPVQGTYTDMPWMKQKLGGKVCLWGGMSGAVTVEMGSEEDVRAAVAQAMQTLGPQGLILSPVDNITVDAPLTWRNIEILRDAWHQHW